MRKYVYLAMIAASALAVASPAAEAAPPQIARVYVVPGSGERTSLTAAGADAAADSRCPLATGTCAMSVASLLRSPIDGDAARGAQDGAQDILGGIGLRAGGDRVGVRPVEIAEADAVVSYLGVVCCQL